MTLTFCKSINPRKQYPPADLEKQDTVLNFQARQNGWHRFASPIPRLTTLNHDCQEKKQKNKKCEPQTCLYPFHVNKTTWCYCQPLLTLLPARPVIPITQQGREERERKKKEKEKQKEKGGGGAVGVYLSQRRPVYPGGQLSQVG